MTRPQSRIHKIKNLQQRIAMKKDRHKEASPLRRDLIKLVAQQLRYETREERRAS